jgi:uncharacterized protein (DUF111 family)
VSGLLYFDCFSGIAGDMTTAALLSLSGAEKELRAALKGLPLSGYRFKAEQGISGGVAGTRVHVNVSGKQSHGRHLPDIVALLRAAVLPEEARNRAIRCFELLGNAEAKVHGTSVDKVHFHEVGAVDAIVDIVSGCFLFETSAPRRRSAPPSPGGPARRGRNMEKSPCPPRQRSSCCGTRRGGSVRVKASW